MGDKEKCSPDYPRQPAERPDDGEQRSPRDAETVRPTERAGDQTDVTTVRAIWADTIKGEMGPRETVKATLERDVARAEAPVPENLDDYELLGVMGRGGMGVVYRARQRSLDREVALKRFHSRGEEAEDATYRTMFASEAVVTGNLDHPNIVPIHSLEKGAGGPSFYTMKCVRGRPWEDLIDRMSLQENLETLLRVCDAMAFAHSRGIIHRDLKPENVMLGEYGEVLVMDWGLAASVEKGAKAEHIETTHQQGGTPAYMAPEQALNDRLRIGKSSDIYLLGAILFRIVAGRPPHDGKDVLDCLRNAAKNKIVQAPRTGELMDIARKAMSTQQRDRHPTVESFRGDIRDYLNHQESVALAHNARADLEAAERGGDYEKFSRAVFGLEQALSLWQDNEDAADLLGRARDSYARAAFQNGDLELALSVVDDDVSPGLREQIESALEERRRRKRALRALKWSILGLTAALVVSLTVGFLWVGSERNRALRESYFATVGLAALKTQEHQFAEARRLLASCHPPLRRWEWGFLRRLGELDMLTFCGHAAEVEALCISPDGKLAASGDWAGAVRLWDPDTGAVVRTLQAHEDAVTDLAFSPDGAQLVSAGDDGTVKLWNVSEGALRATLCELPNEVWSAAFSPTGRWLAAGAMDGTLHVWELPDCREVLAHNAGAGITAVAFSPGGRLAYARGKVEDTAHLTVLQPQTWEPVFSVPLHRKHINELAYSPDGKLIATASWDGTAKLVHAVNGRPFAQLPHGGAVFGAAFSPDGAYLASAAEDHLVRVWQVREPKLFKTFAGHSGPVGAAAFLPDGKRVISCSLDATVKVWDMGADSSGATVMGGHEGTVAGLAFSPVAPLVASAGQDGTVRLWDLRTGQVRRVLDTDGGAANDVAFSGDGQTLAAACWDGAVRVWEVESGALLHRFGAGDRVVRCVDFSPADGLLAAGSWDGAVRVWRPESQELVHTLQLSTVAIQSVAFSPEAGHLAAGGRDQLVHVCDLATGRETATLKGHTGWVRSVDYSPDGRLLVSAGDDNVIKLWRVDGYEHAADLKGHAKWVKSVTFWPDGQRLASADDDGTVKVWAVAAGRDLIGWTAHRGTCWSVAVSPDGRTVGSAGADGFVKIWRAANRQDPPEARSP